MGVTATVKSLQDDIFGELTRLGEARDSE